MITWKEVDMGYLSKAQANRLLGEPIISFLTTINSDGSPHTSPVWHILNEDNSHIWVATSKTSVKARNLRMDQRVSLVSAADRSPQPWVQVNGAACIKEPMDIDDIVSRLAYHYLGSEQAPIYLREILGNIEFVLVDIDPKKILAFDGEE
jgi:PPOX class probable F420-dependent enzyme